MDLRTFVCYFQCVSEISVLHICSTFVRSILIAPPMDLVRLAKKKERITFWHEHLTQLEEGW